MRKLAAIACRTVLFAPILFAPPSHADMAPGCAAARDAALNAIDREAMAIAVAFDTDAAIADAPEHELLKAKEALLEDLEREREAVRERYRRCSGEAQPRR